VRISSSGRGGRRRFADGGSLLLALGILALGWLVLVVYAYPGLMTMDSIDQLNEARSGFFTDSHPPAMSMLWRIVDFVYPGPLGILLIQSIAFVAGLFVVLRRALAPVTAAVATVAVLLFPPVFTPLAVIWKDCIMAGFLVLAIAGLTSKRRNARLAGLAACIAASAVRYNAPAATLPLIVMLFTWSPMPALRRYAIAAGAWIVVTVTALGIGAALTDRSMHIWQSSLALMDITGTLSHLDGTQPDAQLQKTLEGTQMLVDHDIHAALRRQYRTNDYSLLISGDGHLWDVPISGTTPAPQAQRDAITRAFEDVVTSHPVAYLAHRAGVMRQILALTDAPAESTVMHHRLQFAPLLEKLGLSAEPSTLQWRWQKRLSHLASRRLPALFRPWIYLVISLVLLALCRGQRDVFAILLSGIGLELSLFPLAASADYRYSHWLVVCTCIAIVMLVARRINSVHNRARDERP
jgi:hypothetical protein